MPQFNPPCYHPFLHDREGESSEREDREIVRKEENKIVWKIHQFFIHFHLGRENPLTAINRSSCCHTVSTWRLLEGLLDYRALEPRQKTNPPPHTYTHHFPFAKYHNLLQSLHKYIYSAVAWKENMSVLLKKISDGKLKMEHNSAFDKLPLRSGSCPMQKSVTFLMRS